MLNIENLNFGYKKNESTLKNINLNVDSGFTLLVGENGSGKSTLINCITGQLSGSGSIKINEIPCGSEDYAKLISYLPQVFDVYPMLKVREILEFVAGLKGVPKEEVKNEVALAAQRTNTDAFLENKFKKCSEGMKRRVGIAAALMGKSEVIILDEPTAGVDPGERRQFYRTIKECFEGKTVIISTHILDDIESLADSIIMLSRGRVTCHLPYGEFLSSLGREATLEELWMHYREAEDVTVE
ncbi:MAG: ABC transporter ATP-binding protein [Clostridia bacterium]|nr:ABC transporter ATP-binding protein [Clostridia bacterium]